MSTAPRGSPGGRNRREPVGAGFTERFKAVVYRAAPPDSQEAQCQTCLAYAARFNWQVIDIAVEDGPGGTLEERPALRRAVRTLGSDTGVALLTHSSALIGLTAADSAVLTAAVGKSHGFIQLADDDARSDR